MKTSNITNAVKYNSSERGPSSNSKAIAIKDRKKSFSSRRFCLSLLLLVSLFNISSGAAVTENGDLGVADRTTSSTTHKQEKPPAQRDYYYEGGATQPERRNLRSVQDSSRQLQGNDGGGCVGCLVAPPPSPTYTYYCKTTNECGCDPTSKKNSGCPDVKGNNKCILAPSDFTCVEQLNILV